jgi:hypothetical protein
MSFTPCTAGSWAGNGAVTGGNGMAAVALADGTVLLTGGCSRSDGSRGTAGAWLCRNGFVASLPRHMTCIRWGHTATQLRDGRVLLTGLARANDSDAQTAELYDPATQTFTATGRMQQCRGDHTATLLRDGRVLLTGGLDSHGNPSATAELFDPATGTFSATAQGMAVARAHHTATAVAGGRVLIVGDTSAELYDEASGRFVAAAAPGIRRLRHAATALADGRVLVAGGYEPGWVGQPYEEIWSPASNSWQRVTTTGTGASDGARFGSTATLLADGRVLLVGGSTYLNPFQASPTISGLTRLFDPATGQCSTLPGPAQLRRAFHCAARLPTGQVLLAGGVTLGASLATETQLYCPDPAPVQLQLLFTGAGHGRVRSTPPGLDTDVAQTAAFPAGSTVTLDATPAPPRIQPVTHLVKQPALRPLGPGRSPVAEMVRSVCDGWTGDASGSGTRLQLTMDRAKTITVHFSSHTTTMEPPKPRPPIRL